MLANSQERYSQYSPTRLLRQLPVKVYPYSIKGKCSRGICCGCVLKAGCLEQETLEEVEAMGRLERLRFLLSEVEIKGSPAGAKRVKGEEYGSGFTDAINYFVSRRKALETVLSILDEFRDAKSLTSLLDTIDQNALRGVLRLLEGLARLEIPDAYAAISDAEPECNQRFQKGGGRRAAVGGDQYAAKSIIEDKVRELLPC